MPTPPEPENPAMNMMSKTNEVPAQTPVQAKERLVVVGNGMAGIRTVEELLQRDPDRYDITVFGAEPHVNYNRIMLSPVLAGEKTFDQIVLNDRSWYESNGITLFTGEKVETIDRDTRTVTSLSGRTVEYDRLLLATGSDPFIIPVPGRDLPGVVTFRDLDDVDKMLAAAEQGGNAVVIGGGEHLVDVVEIAEGHHARQVAARHRDDERIGTGRDQQLVVRLDAAGAADHSLALAVDVVDRIAGDQFDAVLGIPFGGVEHDFVESLLAGQNRGEHDAVVVHPRLGTEDHHVEPLPVAFEGLFDGAAPGHAVADHDQFLAHRFGRIESRRGVHPFGSFRTTHAKKPPSHAPGRGETGGAIATLCCCLRGGGRFVRRWTGMPRVRVPVTSFGSDAASHFFAVQQRSASAYQLL
jgi:thioredoxin reductase